MNRLVWGTVLVLAWVPGCEVLAGVQDKYLALDASTNEASDTPVPSGGDDGSASSKAPDATAPGGGDGAADGGAVPSSGDSGSSDGATGAAPNPAFVAPDAGSTDPSAPCAQQGLNLFCDDYDLVTSVDKNWTYELLTDDGGTLSLFDGACTSPPQSLQVQAPASTGDQQLSTGFDVKTALTQSFRLAFDVRLDMDTLEGLPQMTTIAQIVGSETPDAQKVRKMEIDYQILSSGSAQLQCFMTEGSSTATIISFPAPPLHEWARVVVSYDATAGITAYQDGVVVGSNATVAGAPDQTSFIVGMVYQVPPGSQFMTYELDNVVFKGN